MSTTSPITVILVLASDNNQIYQNARLVWKAYANKILPESFKIYFVYGNLTTELKFRDKYDLIFPHVEECYNPGMLKKTICAMEWIDKNCENYDFFIRTNISTFWDLKATLRNLKKWKLKGDFYFGDGPLPGYKLDGTYLSGTDTLVSKSMIKKMIVNKESLNYDCPEDEAMGNFFHGELGVKMWRSKMHFMEHFKPPFLTAKIIIEIVKAKIKGEDHYRVKSLISCRLKTDLLIYKVLLLVIYGIRLRID